MKRWVAELIELPFMTKSIDWIGRNGAEFAVTFDKPGDFLAALAVSGVTANGCGKLAEFGAEVKNIIIQPDGKVAV